MITDIMLAKDLISDIVPALDTNDSGLKALNWMEIFRISHLPVLKNKEFIGLISDNDIFDFNMVEEPIGNHKLSLTRPFVYSNQHIYEIIEIVSRQRLSIVPVLDTHKNYLGIITLHDLIQYFSKITAVENKGAIIVLELNVNDYYLTEISNIVEENDVKILSLYVHTPEDSTKIELTLKLNKVEISPIIQSLERYDYTIKSTFSEDEEVEQLYQNRYEEFMNYLNI